MAFLIFTRFSQTYLCSLSGSLWVASLLFTVLSTSQKLMSPTNLLKVHSTALSKSATKRLNHTSCTCRLLKKYYCLHTATELLSTTWTVTIHPIPHTLSGPSINSYRSHTGQYQMSSTSPGTRKVSSSHNLPSRQCTNPSASLGLPAHHTDEIST